MNDASTRVRRKGRIMSRLQYTALTNKDRDVVERGWQDERRMEERSGALTLALFGVYELCSLVSWQTALCDGDGGRAEKLSGCWMDRNEILQHVAVEVCDSCP